MKLSIILVLVSLTCPVLLNKLNCAANPFTHSLINKNVTFLQEPIFTSRRCGSEWKQHGSCCEETGLITYSIEDRKEITEAVQGLVDSLKVLQFNLSNILNLSSSFKTSDLNQLNNSEVSTAIGYLKTETSTNLNQYLAGMLKEKNLPTNLTTCWNKIATIRSNSLCSVCSSRSTSFFQGRKILINLWDCNSIMSQCAPAFNRMIEVISRFENFFSKFISDLEFRNVDGKYKKNLEKWEGGPT